MIIYLHGFNSSGSLINDKVVELKKLDDVYVVSYDSYDNAHDILEKISAEVEHIDDKIFIGTSLGGFFSAQLALKFGCPSVLINPAFTPEITLRGFVGIDQANYVTGEHNVLTNETVDSYKELPAINIPSDFSIIPLVILAEDDELIPAEKSAEYFKDLILITTPTGGHRYDKPKQIMGFISKYINQTEFVSHIDT